MRRTRSISLPVRDRLTGRLLFLSGVLLTGLVMALNVYAASRSEVSLDGRRVIVEGARTQAVSSINGGYHINVDGSEIRVTPGQITVDGETHQLRDFQELRVEVKDGKTQITVDGEPL